MLYRAAIIGCGNIGSYMDECGHPLGTQTHASAYAQNERTQLVGISDSNKKRLQECAAHRHLENFFIDHNELLRECLPDIVSVAVPTEHHFAVLQQVIRTSSVKLVICEKPIAANVQETAKLIELAGEYNCRLVVNYCRHYLPSMVTVRNLIRGGSLGSLRLVRGIFTKTLMHNGSHILDLFNWWFGGMTVQHAASACWANGDQHYPDALLKVRDGSFAITMHALDAADFGLFEIDVIGSAGRVKISESGNNVRLFKIEEDAMYKGYRRLVEVLPAMENCLFDMMSFVLSGALDYLEGKEEARQQCCTGDDALAVLRLSEMITETAGRERGGVCV